MVRGIILHQKSASPQGTKIVWQVNNFGDNIWGLSVDGTYSGINDPQYYIQHDHGPMIQNDIPPSQKKLEWWVVSSGSQLPRTYSYAGWTGHLGSASLNNVTVFTKKGSKAKLQASGGKKGSVAMVATLVTLSKPAPQTCRIPSKCSSSSRDLVG